MTSWVRYVALPALVTVTALTACSSSSSSHTDAGGATTVAVSVSACGQGWTSGKAGPQKFVLSDTDTRSGEVDLVSARGGAVYAEVEPIGAGSSTTMDTVLGAGQYAFRCFMEDEPMVTGPTVTLTGSARGTAPAVAAVSQGDLIGSTKAYESYVTAALPVLAAKVATVRKDVDSGDLAAARRDWLPAHQAYQRLGAAYGAFGDIADDIDGLADGLTNGVHDTSWHGFHRLEYGLWHGQSAAALRPVAARLVSDVATLRRSFPDAQVDPLDIGIRAHEITEDAVEFTLAGRDDYGSHSALPSLVADIDATQEVLKVVHAVLAPRYRGLATADQDLATTAHDVDALRTSSGSWPALAALSRADRERINADVSQLAEELAPVASILEPRRTS